eukprot:650145-Prymnesium_polylepis.1
MRSWSTSASHARALPGLRTRRGRRAPRETLCPNTARMCPTAAEGVPRKARVPPLVDPPRWPCRRRPSTRWAARP